MEMEKEHLEIILENMDSKFALILESYSTLDQKLDRKFDELKNNIELVNFKIDTVNEHLTKRIDAIATDLKAHRNDTEAHQIYQVKEGS